MDYSQDFSGCKRIPINLNLELTGICRTWTIAGLIGPVVGGSLADIGQWRWLFCVYPTNPDVQMHSSLHRADLNLPIAAIAALFVAIFMELPTPPGTLADKVRRMDWM